MPSPPARISDHLPAETVYNRPLLLSLAAIAMMPVAEASISSVISRYISPVPAVEYPSFNRAIRETDKSGRIIVGGIPQVIIGANSSRRAFLVANPANASEVLQVSIGGSGHYIDLLPGATWEETGTVVWTANIYAKAKTAAHEFTAYEGT